MWRKKEKNPSWWLWKVNLVGGRGIGAASGVRIESRQGLAMKTKISTQKKGNHGWGVTCSRHQLGGGGKDVKKREACSPDEKPAQ